MFLSYIFPTVSDLEDKRESIHQGKLRRRSLSFRKNLDKSIHLKVISRKRKVLDKTKGLMTK